MLTMVFSQKFLFYLGILFAVILLLMTLSLLMFPRGFSHCDVKYQLKKLRKSGLERFALFLNHAIAIETVGVGYSLLSMILILLGQWKILGITLGAILLSSLLFRSLKRITQRLRPLDAKLHFSDYSFPSGHTTAGFVMMLSLALCVAQFLSPCFQVLVYGLAFFMGGIIGWSRRYLKVHRITDILAGAILGIGSFIAMYLFFTHFGDRIIRALELGFITL